MPTFDGYNLIVTMDSGVTEVAFKDFYAAWKQWLLDNNSNMKYPPLFRPLGGDELTSIINAGSYFFFNNVAGWRMRPPEEDITIYITGNVAPQSSSLPIMIPTIGGYTAAIFGLQPITQGVTESMASQLAFNTFQGHVAVNGDTGYEGTGEVNGTPIGTLKYPAKYMVDVLAIAVREGLGDITFHSNMTLTGLDFSTGYNFVASSPTKLITVNPGADVTSCSFKDMRLVGELDGFNLAERASLEGCTNMSGFGFYVSFKGANTLNGDMELIECMSGDDNTSFDIGPYNLQTMKWSKDITIKGALAGRVSHLEVQGGEVTLDSTCVGGDIYIHGTPHRITDNSGAGCVVYIETESAKVNDIHGQVARELWFDSAFATDGNGYQQTPYKVLNNLIDDAEASRITSINTYSDITLTRDLKNIKLSGIGMPTFDAAGYDLKGMEFWHLRFEGLSTSPFIMQQCNILAGAGLYGFIQLCTFEGDTELTGNTHIIEGVSNQPGDGYFSIDTNGFILQTTNWRRSLGIKNMTSGVHTIQMNGGQLHLDTGCTGGIIYLRGDYSLPPDNLGSTVIIDGTGSKKRDDDWQFKGLDPDNPIARSGDGVNEEILTVDGKVLTITPTTIIRT